MDNTFVQKKLWEKLLKGWLITGCVLRNKDYIYLCARKNLSDEERSRMLDSEVPTRFIALYTNNPENPCSARESTGYNMPIVGVSRKPVEQGLLASLDNDGYVSVMGPGSKSPEFIDKGAFPANTLKCVQDYAYAVGIRRDIYKRVDAGEWVKFDKGIVRDESKKYDVFKDIDAFTEQDMYVIGGKGDVWHYDGESWSQCEFPSKEKLSAVVCTPDGNVYIGGEGGNIWKGKANNWKKIYSSDYTILWNKMRWFENQLWVISDYMLRILENGELVCPKDGEGNGIVLQGHMDVYDGIMVISTLDSVYTFDGKTLQTIVTPYK